MTEQAFSLTKGVIALLVIGILFVAYKNYGIKPVEAQVKGLDSNLEKYTGINLFDFSRILAVQADVDESGALNVNWKVNKDAKDAIENGGDYRVEFLYKKYQNSPLDTVCTAFLIQKSGQEMKAESENAKMGYICSVDGQKATLNSVSGDTATPAPAGQYTIRVSVKGKKEKKFEEEAEHLFSFYTRDYLDSLDQDIPGCSDCNVGECKRSMLADSLSHGGKCSTGVKNIYYQAYQGLFGSPIGISDWCKVDPGKVPLSLNDNKLAFKTWNCPIETVNRINAKAAQWIFFEKACSGDGVEYKASSGLELEGERVVSNDLSLPEIPEYPEGEMVASQRLLEGSPTLLEKAYSETEEELSRCMEKVEKGLDSLGWKYFVSQEETQRYSSSKLKLETPLKPHNIAQLDAFLEADKIAQKSFTPSFDKLKVTTDGTDGSTLTLTWNLATGAENVKDNALSITTAYRGYMVPGEVHGLNTFFRNYVFQKEGNFEVNPTLQTKSSLKSYSFMPKKLIGQHRFLVEANSASGGSVSGVQVDAGFYNEQYVELYKDITGVNDACNAACDVIGKKEITLEASSLWPYTQRAYDASQDSLQLNCKTDSGATMSKFRINGCTEGEINLLYTKAITAWAEDYKSSLIYNGRQITANDLLKVNCFENRPYFTNPGLTSSFINNFIYGVCAAKDNLKKELLKAGWTYVGG